MAPGSLLRRRTGKLAHLLFVVDATRLDGRLFAAIAPAYVDGVTLEDLAGRAGV